MTAGQVLRYLPLALIPLPLVLRQTGAGPTLEVTGLWIMVVATALTIVSGWDYLRGALPILRGGRT